MSTRVRVRLAGVGVAMLASVAWSALSRGIVIRTPSGITAGPDGALWFTNGFGHGSIGRITTKGAVTFYRKQGIDNPMGITVGPDGALWFTNYDNSSIGRITSKGAISFYTQPVIHSPREITAGPDGALWFTTAGDSIGRITTKGAINTYRKGISDPEGITAGPDGAPWFTNGDQSIGRITTKGGLSFYTHQASTAGRDDCRPGRRTLVLQLVGVGNPWFRLDRPAHPERDRHDLQTLSGSGLRDQSAIVFTALQRT